MNLRQIRVISVVLLAFSCAFVFRSASAQNVPKSSHVWLITEENHSYEDVVGSSQMPYYNQLLKQYGLATQFYANQHTSLPALMWFVAGASVEPNNQTTSCQHGNDNIVRELLQHGYSWRSYQENLPYAGYQGLFGGPNNSYARRHNPLVDFTDVCPGTGQDKNSVPYSQMAQDFAQGDPVNYVYITPSMDEDAHNGSLQAADQWLQAHVPAILARPEFMPGGDGLLFVVWDEGTLTDYRCSSNVQQGCGGRTATLIIGPQVKPDYKSAVTYHNENVLKTVCVAMGISTCPGAAQNAAPMADFFTTGTPSGGQPDGVIISTPGNGAVVVGKVHLIASASESKTVRQTQVWDNHVKLGMYGTQIDATYDLAPGNHTITVVDLDSSYKVIHQAAASYSVQALADGLQVISPTPAQTISLSTVHMVAHANESVAISQIQVWDNGTKLAWYAGADVNDYFTLAPGSHTVTMLDLDGNYNVIHRSSVAYSVQ